MYWTSRSGLFSPKPTAGRPPTFVSIKRATESLTTYRRISASRVFFTSVRRLIISSAFRDRLVRCVCRSQRCPAGAAGDYRSARPQLGIRSPSALDPNNASFAGSDAGAEQGATLCKLYSVWQTAYVSELFIRIVVDNPQN